MWFAKLGSWAIWVVGVFLMGFPIKIQSFDNISRTRWKRVRSSEIKKETIAFTENNGYQILNSIEIKLTSYSELQMPVKETWKLTNHRQAEADH